MNQFFSNAKCAENNCFDSSKNIGVQSEDKLILGSDMGKDIVHASNHGVTTNTFVIAIQKFNNDNSSCDCSNIEQEPLEEVAGHITQDEDGKCLNQLQARENNQGKKQYNFVGKDEVVAAVFPCELAPSIQPEIGETFSPLENAIVVIP